MIRKMLCFILALAMTLSLAACGAGGKSPKNIIGDAISDAESVVKKISDEYDDVHAKLDTFEKYRKDHSALTGFYEYVESELDSFVGRMDEYYESYYRKCFKEYKDPKDLYEAMRNFQEEIFEGVFKSLYNGIVDDTLVTAFDDYYNGIIEDGYDLIDYDEWAEINAASYDEWNAAIESIYDVWDVGITRFYDITDAMYDGVYDEERDFDELMKVAEKMIAEDLADAD